MFSLCRLITELQDCTQAGTEQCLKLSVPRIQLIIIISVLLRGLDSNPGMLFKSRCSEIFCLKPSQSCAVSVSEGGSAVDV